MKSIYDSFGGTYTRQGDYGLPDLVLPKEDTNLTDVWAQLKLNYLKHNCKVLYYYLLTTRNLHSYLTDIEQGAEEVGRS